MELFVISVAIVLATQGSTLVSAQFDEDILPCTTRYPVGTCPLDPTRGSCEEDSDCPLSGQKCCDDGCGAVCRNGSISTTPPIETLKNAVSGTCPIPTSAYLPFCRFITYGPPCSKDSDCHGRAELCCPNRCGKICVTPVVPVTTGEPSTPPVPHVTVRLPQPTPRVTARLTPPTPSLPIYIQKGTCPYHRYFPYNCTSPTRHTCIRDAHCGPSSRCCRNPCSYTCRRVHVYKSGNCPAPPSFSAIKLGCTYYDRCRDDAGCPGAQKCCAHPCGKQCITRVTSKPGQCGALRRHTIYCLSYYDVCHKDTDCDDNKKCCKSQCGNQCRRPVRPPKPGVCPPKRTNVRCVRWQTDCINDHNCYGSSKCCNTGCGMGCVLPTRYIYSG